ncbi:glycosyl hydrolase family 67 middle domain-containing protein [Colletotrichum graminicola M1.001]|uniref:Alpha-glucuronidase n=1 Tax=Colletotrichum graminicola (strain M1.001 / M2 / FGSC 10212) TaxID=645133 RepID=E3QEE2_COLGM|nr:glycosyl hydrolase family 67 middle domain-containing protein [Colletotrichum graminicola M1.001]EFQ29248.1 glycosyl hydrolase family 67 middle domain-containing protein [Colletotrichum graminicola M1.001]
MWKLLLIASLGLVIAEDGLAGWLRYARLPDCKSAGVADSLPSTIVGLNATENGPISSALSELTKGYHGIFGKEVSLGEDACADSSVVVATLDDYIAACGSEGVEADLIEDGFWLSIKGGAVKILGQNERGTLYGAFEYLSLLAQGNFTETTYATNPSAPVRWANQWDNMDGTGTHGSIERGYGGVSIFFENLKVVTDMTRISQYGRLLASARINGIIVNNVNANPILLSPDNMDGLKRIADAFRPWGVQVGISLNFASPQTFGGLSTFDPLDDAVIAWWGRITDELYARIPDMAGYLVKANSEGQPGPLTYNRTLADGANLFARELKNHGSKRGIVMFRAFVYDHLTLNESDWHADRANAQVEFFKHLDGQFDDNVIVQIKYGAIDFQVREPVSPLFANLKETSMAIELQISQEYLGQQDHLVYLPPLWKTILDFDLRIDGQPSPVRDILSGKRLDRPLGGYAGVINVGANSTWLGSHLAMSNLYAYGRLAWNPTDDVVAIVQDWSRLTFGLNRKVVDTITSMSMESWPAYENYSGNLGIQTLTDILYAHYGPSPRSQDGNSWGQWTRADGNSIGMDRTVKNGTGNAGMYPPEVAAIYEEIETTPDDLLLWFHHVPYTHVLKSGKTVIQHFYDAHYEGSATTQTFVPQWESLQGLIDEERYEHVLFKLQYQAGHSLVWRDSINNFYWNMSGIPDEAGRVGNYKYRIEAEHMNLEGYKVVNVDPFEAASGYKAIVTTSNTTAGTASTVIGFETGTYTLAVNYFDVIRGKCSYVAYINDKVIGQWRGNSEEKLGHWPSEFLDGHSAIRINFPGVKVTKGDTLKIVGTPDGPEVAPLDYVSFLPNGIID